MLVLTNVMDTRDGPTVQLPNNETTRAAIAAKHTLENSLSAHAKNAQIFDGLHSASLISLGQLCDNDCIYILDKNKINILKGKTLIFKGHRNKTYGLWDIPISIQVRNFALSIIKIDKTKTELIQYLHECCFSLIPRTLLKAIKNGNFLTWPFLNNQQLLKHLTPIIATALGNMEQYRKNLQSTKHVKSEVEVE